MDSSQPAARSPASPIAVRMLPAGHGDALVVEWDGDHDGDPVRGRVVVDAGPVGAFAAMAPDLRGAQDAATPRTGIAEGRTEELPLEDDVPAPQPATGNSL